ncbi:MAG: hypothetical protein HY525_05540 [Betaproteobacteria bacterium]|nr:hypothetical protein [Betaproteobacteria bacterium]
MNKASSAIIAVLIAAAFPVASYAGTRDPGVNHRQHNQQQRIQQGVRSGELTRGEARHLGREARDIRREERIYKSDGNLSRWERADLRRDLNGLSRDIYREKHDRQQRFDRGRYDNAGFDPRRFDQGRFDQRRFDNGRFDPRPGNPGHFGSRDIDRMQRIERERIQRGIRSGELTRSEAARLIAEQRMIQQEERAYRADGVLTGYERRDLWQDLNAASRHIYNETHDGQERR